MPRMAKIAVLLVALTGGGCGTVANLSNRDKIYGGAQIDGASALHAYKELIHPNEPAELTTNRDVAVVFGSCVDLPLSCIADTFTLPITCYHSIKDRNHRSDSAPADVQLTSSKRTADHPAASGTVGSTQAPQADSVDQAAATTSGQPPVVSGAEKVAAPARPLSSE